MKEQNILEQDTLEQYKTRIERVVRWDNYRINHFSYTNNLLLGLDLGFLGFFITQSGLKFCCNCYFITIQVFAILFLFTSFFTGLLTVLNRLKDFKKTSQLTKMRKKKFEHVCNIILHSDIDKINSEIFTLSSETRELGNQTWSLLKWQVCTFIIGTFIGVIYLIIFDNLCS